MDVMISIQPYWVFLIIAKAMGWNAREKTIEVRKNFPKDENWSKIVKIYCSKNKQSFAKIPKEYQPSMEKFLGKVVGEFVCDKIIDIDYGVEEGVYFDGDFQEGFETNGEGNNPTCLSFVELEKYLTANEGYGWHISDLSIYDKPKSLWDFVKPGCPTEQELDDELCSYCSRTDYGEKKGYSYPGGYVSCEGSYCSEAYDEYLEDEWAIGRAPQSWCYCEVMPQ